MPNAIHIRPMREADLPFADSVRSAAGWNQTFTDWCRLREHDPDGCFVAELDGVPAGTVTTTRYGADLAWIGMVLVDPARRRRGAGRALLEHAIGHLQRQGVRGIKLDATPLGKPLYDRLGFRVEWELARWESDPAQRSPLPEDEEPVRALAQTDWTWVEAIDRPAFGADRRGLLRLLARDSVQALVHGSARSKLAGFGFLRRGSRAGYLGPAVAEAPDAGVRLIAELARRASAARLFWDVPEDNVAAVRLVKALGFERQRELIRMFLGENRAPSDPLRQFAIGGPETG